MQGLRNLSLVRKKAEISNNLELSGIEDLKNLTTINESLTIKNNPNLSNCAIEIICNNIDKVTVEGNAAGCNNTLEVIEECPNSR